MQPLEALVELERRGAAPERFRPILQELDQAGLLTSENGGPPGIAGIIELYNRGVLNDRDAPDFNRDLGRRFLPIMQRLVSQQLVEPYVPQNQRDTGASAYLRRATHGLTFGFSDEIQAGLGAVRDRITGDAPSLSEGYDYNIAVQRANLDRARRETGVVGTAAEVVGGLGRPSQSIMAGAGTQAMSTGQRTAEAAAYGAGFGAVQGFGEAEGGIENRIVGAVQHGVVGGAIGGALGYGISRYGDWRAARRAAADGRNVEAAATNQNVVNDFNEAGEIGRAHV